MRKLKQLMQIISQISPFKPNYSDLARDISVNRSDLKDYLFYMEKSGMIQSIISSEKGLNLLSKVEKIYLDNTNLMTALSNETTNIGNMRETFFFNQLKVKNQVTSSPVSDFLINNKYTFEKGGRKKGKKTNKRHRQLLHCKRRYRIRLFKCNTLVGVWIKLLNKKSVQEIFYRSPCTLFYIVISF